MGSSESREGSQKRWKEEKEVVPGSELEWQVSGYRRIVTTVVASAS